MEEKTQISVEESALGSGRSYEGGSNSSQPPMPPQKQAIPGMVWTIGTIMFFACVSAVIIFSYSGLYLKEELHYSLSKVGFLEGFAEGVSQMTKLVAGILSDLLRKRKILMCVGYGIIVLSRYVLATLSGFGIVIVLTRIMERIGNGIQAAPRSALVNDISPAKRVGACYGLKRSLATIGSCVGAILAIAIMKLSGGSYRALFWFTTIPSTIGFILLVFKVKEPKKIEKAAIFSSVPSHAPKYQPTFSLRNSVSHFKILGPTFGKLMIVNFIFLLARMGEAFLIIHARDELHISREYIPTVMIVFNLAWAASSYPVGLISEKLNKYWLLCLGMSCLILADIVLATSHRLWTFYIGIMLWGVQYGSTMNIFLSLISEVVPETLRGTSLGIYFVTCAVAITIGDSFMGFIAQRLGSTRAAFVASGIISILGLMSLIIIMGYKIKNSAGGGRRPGSSRII